LKKAIVIGAGIAGLIAARVLSEYAETVTLIERDNIDDDFMVRKGVPQSMQPHVLLAKGYNLLQDFFPDMISRMLANGATSIDWGKEFKVYLKNGWGANTVYPTEMISLVASRSLLERSIRNEICKIDNIYFLSSRQVKKLIYDPSKLRVSGVKVNVKGDSLEQKILADLVVDCSGRNSQAQYWLKAIGYDAPPIMEIDPDLGYSTVYYAAPSNFTTSWRIMKVSHKPPERKRLGFLSRIEGDRIIATLGGYCQDYPPTNHKEFIEYARSLPCAEFADVIANLEPISRVYPYRATGNKRRHFEKIEMPEGFITFGEAVCSLCPAYGQGMTVAILSAKIFQDWLENEKKSSADFQRRLAKFLDLPWNMVTNADAPFLPNIEEKNNFFSRLMQKYGQIIFDKMSEDAVIYKTSLEVSQFLKSPIKLFHPAFVLRLLF
jgi:flavin-dependent dehydrogenase